MKILTVVGARPNFIKAAPVLRALEARGHDSVLVHTEQHYDHSMSETFFRDLGLPRPHHLLGVGSGTHAQQTAWVMLALEPVLVGEKPDWVVVIGDVNSTLAASLVASKLEGQLGCRIAHVEAGLRSGNWSMPEEINRVLTDRLSHLLLTPSRDAAQNLRVEGVEPSRIRFVGNVMIDTLFHLLPAARSLATLNTMGLEAGGYAVATLHRPGNVDHPDVLEETLAGLAQAAQGVPVVLPLHPRTRQQVEAFGLGPSLDRLLVTEPLGYVEMLGLLDAAMCVLTDSGGIQEESTALGVPCITLRPETERPITVTQGTNALAPWPPTRRGIPRAIEEASSRDRRTVGEVMDLDALRSLAPEGWDGRAGGRMVTALEELNGDPAA